MTDLSTGTLADAAVGYARAGWEIFPGNPRTKAPLTEHGMLDAAADIETVERWWRQHPEALVCARVPGDLVLFDVDVRHGGDTTWTQLKADLGPLLDTRVHHSGRGDGGGHVWYRHILAPGEKYSTAALDQWAREHEVGQATPTGGWTAGIDLLHHGHRYTILPPSLHPDTGKPYTWKTRPDAMVVDLPEMLAQLIVCAASPSVAANGNGHQAATDNDSIAEWYTTQHPIETMLTTRGWTQVGRGKWRHPQASNAHSATVKHGCLFVYTPTPGLPVTEPGDPHGLTPFRLYALLEHHGDLSAAASAARRLKDGDRPANDLSWANGNGAKILGPQTMEPPTPETWPEPQPLVDVHTPPFPLHVLPDWIGDHCEAVADRLQVPPDLCAQLALGAVAAITMGHVNIHVTGTWTEPANLYLTTVMPSGSGKSPADKFMVTGLRRLETELIERSQEDRKRAQHDKSVAEKRARKLTEKAAGAGDDAMERATRDAWAAQQAADTIEEQPEPRLLAADVTPEMLAVLLDRHDGRIAIVSTEADLYDVVSGSYSRRPNISVFLKAWSGDEVIVDRKGGSGSAATAIRVPEALVTVSLTVQPVALASLRRIPELETKGFIPRFMHAWPQDLVGTRDHTRALDTRPLTTTGPYEDQILRMGRSMAGWLTAGDLHYTADASRALIDWEQHLEAGQAPGGELAHLRSWIPKIVGSSARLAGLLHLCDAGSIGEPVQAETVDRALEVGRYWLAHAGVVLAQSGGDLWGADRVLAWLRDKQPATFTRRDVFCGNRRQFPDAESTETALDRLVDVGWIREIGEMPKRSHRRSVIYEPHPSLLGVGE